MKKYSVMYKLNFFLYLEKHQIVNVHFSIDFAYYSSFSIPHNFK